MAEWFEWRDAPSADFAVVGDPVSHSLSPQMHQAAYAALGKSLRYVAVRVPAEEFEIALDDLANKGYQGLNVTVPLKEKAFAWCRETDELGRRVGAINTLRLQDGLGINTDGPGFLDTLSGLTGRALILGAGGSTRAIATTLSEAGFDLAIWNRTRSKAEDLVIQLGIDMQIVDEPVTKGFDLVLNATSASLQGASLKIDWTDANCLAYDLMYSREPSAFLTEAISKGCTAMDGLPLLVAQGARSLEWWLGIEAPRKAMAEAVGCVF